MQCIFVGSVNIYGNEIIPSLSVKNLGVHIDIFMTFGVHIEEMRKMIMGSLVNLNRIKAISLSTQTQIVEYH